MANKIKIVVGGVDYIVYSDDNEEYLRGLGDELGRRMDLLASSKPFLSTTMVAVMTALDYLDQNKKLAAEIDKLKVQIKDRSEDSASARIDAEEARREIERLSRENSALRAKLVK